MLFLPQDPSSTLHLSGMPAQAPVVWDCFLVLPYFHDLDCFEDYWPSILQNIPNLGFPDIFLMIRPGLWAFGKNIAELQCC